MFAVVTAGFVSLPLPRRTLCPARSAASRPKHWPVLKSRSAFACSGWRTFRTRCPRQLPSRFGFRIPAEVDRDRSAYPHSSALPAAAIARARRPRHGRSRWRNRIRRPPAASQADRHPGQGARRGSRSAAALQPAGERLLRTSGGHSQAPGVRASRRLSSSAFSAMVDEPSSCGV